MRRAYRARTASEHADLAEGLAHASALFATSLAGSGRWTEAALVLRKLATLREHIARVRRRRPASADTFATDVDLQDASALSFVVAVQEASDIALHIAADEAWGLPETYADAFELLAKHGVITVEHAKQLGDCARVRNRIVHGYTSVDAARLWNELPLGLDGLDRYVAAIASLMTASP